jgi:hypothetical protein
MIGPGYRFLELGEGWRCWRRTKPSIVGEGFEQDGFAWCRKLRVEVIVQSLGQPLYGDKGRMNTATGVSGFWGRQVDYNADLSWFFLLLIITE